MRFPLGLYRVAGDSMRPTYQTGDVLLGLRWFRPRPGQVVIVNQRRPLVKRLTRIESGVYWVEGDNTGHSTDSRHFGPVTRAQLEARILAKLG